VGLNNHSDQHSQEFNMGMGDYGEHCQNCNSFNSKRPDRRFCERHNFVMPIVSYYVICANWQSQGKSQENKFVARLEKGFLYAWDPYLRPSPQKLDRFEAIQDLFIDLDVTVIENPEHGFLIYLPQRKDAFPEPGETISISIDLVPVEFLIRNIDITVTYTRRNAEGKLDMEDRHEMERVALPLNNGQEVLINWLDKYHNLAEARKKHAHNLANPQFFNKNKPLRLFEYVTGHPKTRSYTLNPGLGVPFIE
jgi:hypothetical protein